ncbi:MAG: hypothetical protein ACYC3I_02515 [Gemmataceae bacterium]
MKRILLAGMFVILFGCATPPERAQLQPLPETGQVLPYAELLTRIRAQARTATYDSYVDQWKDLEDVAEGIEQTARFLSKATEVPEKNKKTLKEVTDDLGKSARKLKSAAAAHNVEDATKALQQINSRVRDLRLTD